MPLPRRARAATSSAAPSPATNPMAGVTAAADAGEDGDGDGRGRGGADAGEIWIDQRVAQHALHDRPAERQRRADRRAHADAWKAQLPDDRVQHARAAGMRERSGNLLERQRRAADEQARAARDDGECGQEDELDGAVQRPRTSSANARPGIGNPA